MGLCSGKCTSTARLDGKTAVITGCNTGIGKETVLDFYRRGCRVIMACRDIRKAESAKEEIEKELKSTEGVGSIVVKKLDLSSLASVRTFAYEILSEEPRINLLINNAGVMMCPKSLTEDGFEMQFGTNHLGHFLLTMLLLPRILHSAPGRIVNVSSIIHSRGRITFDNFRCEKSYSPMDAYARSKLANILFTKELAKRLEGHNVNSYSLHPGVIKTELGRHFDKTIMPGARWIFRSFGGVFIKTPVQGAQTTIFCAVDEDLGGESGLYYSDCRAKTPAPAARDIETAKKLWDISLEFTGLSGYDPLTEPDRRLPEGTGVTVYSLHPGVIATELGRHLDRTTVPGVSWIYGNCSGVFMKTPLQGAQTQIYCATDEDVASESGLYYSDCKVKTPSRRARDMETAKKLWNVSLQFTNLENYDPFQMDQKQHSEHIVSDESEERYSIHL